MFVTLTYTISWISTRTDSTVPRRSVRSYHPHPGPDSRRWFVRECTVCIHSDVNNWSWFHLNFILECSHIGTCRFTCSRVGFLFLESNTPLFLHIHQFHKHKYDSSDIYWWNSLFGVWCMSLIISLWLRFSLIIL